jgi:hypothetical protein
MAAASKSQYYSAFTPQIVPGVRAWYDSADSNSMILVGSAVSQWNDKSGNNYHATQVNAGNRPTFGGSGVSFRAVNSNFLDIAIPWTTTFSVFLVGEADSSDVSGYFFSQGSSVTPRGPSIVVTGGTSIRYIETDATRTDSFLYSATPTMPFVVSVGRPTFGQFIGDYNGRRIATMSVSTTLTTSNWATIGCARQSSTSNVNFVTGKIYELIFYNRHLDTAEHTLVNTYLGWKWGLAATLFSPLSLPNLALWLDGADPTSVTLSGSNVTQWNDKSGRGCNATQVIAARQPTYDLITKRLNFTRASSQYLDLPNSTLPTGDTSYAYFVVGVTRQDLSGMGFIGGGNYGTTNGIFAFETITTLGLSTSWQNNDFASSGGGYTINSNMLFETTYQSGGSRFMFINGGERGSNLPSGARNQGISNNTVGVTSIASGRYLNGSIRELLVYSNALTTQERQGVENYLMTKWRINVATSNAVPITNPYRLEIPRLRTFIPADISFNCQIWVDAADAATIDVCQTTLTVQAIRPKGAFGTSTFPSSCNLSNAVGFSWNQNVFNGNYPAFYHGGGPRTASRLGVNTDVSLAQPLTIHFVCDKINVDNGFGYIMDSTSSAPRVAIYNHNLALFAGLGIGQTADTSLTVPSIAGAIANNTTSQTYYNGILRASGSTSNQALRGLTMANRFSLDSGWDGHLSEFMIHNGVLPSNDRQSIEGYLAWKWGLVNNMSNTHPYRLYPPMTVKFNPLIIPFCRLWLDAADPMSIDLSGSSSNIIFWRDKSALNTIVSNTATVGRPVYVSNNNESYVEFNGTNQFMAISDSVTTTSFTIFVVEKRTSDKASNYFLGGNQVNIAYDIGMGYISDTSVNFQFNGTTSFASVPSYTSDENIRIWSFWRAATGRVTHENGDIRTTGVSGGTVTPWLGFAVGRYRTSFYAGRVYEVLCYNLVLPSNQRMQVEGYLAHKWGRDGSFNVVHPYRTVTP